MRLPLLSAALSEMPNYRESGDGINVSIRCPFCGDSEKREDGSHLSIKIDVGPGEPVMYQCFRASCGAKGILTTSKLQEMGITDMDVITELARHNKEVGPGTDKPFIVRQSRDYMLSNLPTEDNRAKLDYVNSRLGTDFSFQDLSALKIQTSLLDLLRINGIRRLSVKKPYALLLDSCTVGFISMYSDYMICRDITANMETGNRYYNYRLSGKADPSDLKVYKIPGEIALLDPDPAVINVAEGPFSILGAYLHSGKGKEHRNSIWMANCGSQYETAIMHVCRQYGLLTVIINIWSDSEIKIGYYQKLMKNLMQKLHIVKMNVWYNDRAEDFGHRKRDIRLRRVELI